MSDIGDDLAEIGPEPVRRTVARIMAAVRAGEALCIPPLALAAAIPPVSLRWLVPALVGFSAWSATYAVVAFTRGLTAWLVVTDVAITVLLCLANGRLVAIERISDGSGWVATLATLCVIGLPLAWPARAAVPAGLVVAAAFVAGSAAAGHAVFGWSYAAILVGQLAAATVVMTLVRRAGRAADAALAAAAAARRTDAVEQARRADQASQLRLLHDTALTTLTLVGTGAVDHWSARLAGRAAADLATVEQIADIEPEAGSELVELGQVLADVVGGVDRPTVAVSLQTCRVPEPVAKALARAVAEALRNVARHAGTTTAQLNLRADGGTAVVEISDQGRGFDPDNAPAYRFGVRESIVARVSAVGGRARVESRPGVGTRWLLEWPGDGD